jgi:hypothetical protein
LFYSHLEGGTMKEDLVSFEEATEAFSEDIRGVVRRFLESIAEMQDLSDNRQRRLRQEILGHLGQIGREVNGEALFPIVRKLRARRRYCRREGLQLLGEQLEDLAHIIDEVRRAYLAQKQQSKKR